MDNTKIYDPAGCRRRADEAIKKIAGYTTPFYDGNGVYTGKEYLEQSLSQGSMCSREDLWLGAVMLASGQAESVKKANALFRKNIAARSISGSFNLHAILTAVMYYPERTDPDVMQGVKVFLETELNGYFSDEIGYYGINDNFPSMDCCIMIIGGKLIGRPDCVRRGHDILKMAVSMLKRRGLMSEYGSPTYTPISLACMADIVNLTDDEAIRADALAVEIRIWADVLGRYHPGTCQMAGPHSRSYMIDSVGHTHKARNAYSILFGDEMGVNVMNTILSGVFGEPKEVTHHGPHMLMATLGIYMLPDYHCPEYMALAAKNRSYPYVFSATAESRERWDVFECSQNVLFPGGVCRSYTYMEKDYAVGTATKEFSNGSQTECFFINYNRKNPARCQGDTATVFVRYVTDDLHPGEAFELMPFKMHCKKEDAIMDAGRKFAIQEKNSGFVAYGGKSWVSGGGGASALSLALFFPVHYAEIESFWLGDRLIDTSKEGVCGESAQPVPFYVKDGPVIMGFKPTDMTDFGRAAAVRVRRMGDYVVVNLYNYEGKHREFEERDILLAKNGFAFEVREAADMSVGDMRTLIGSIEISDEIIAYDKRPTGRTIHVSREGLDIYSVTCPLTESIRAMTVNGLQIEAPVFYSSDIPAEKLPLYSPGWNTPRLY